MRVDRRQSTMHRIAVAALVLLPACGGDDDGLVFGASPEPCAPVIMTNDADDQAKLQRGADCLVAAIDAGEPVTWDVLAVTVEGDPIPRRYAYDGESVVITDDSSRDEFGRGGVHVRRCAAVDRTDWFPEGRDCVGADGPGFDDSSLP